MGTSKASTTAGQPLPSGGDRLESWKEIAGHFKRGVSTVQRWEKEEGLPVHRHLHDKQGTVYAYRPELDAWWQNGHTRLETVEPVEKSSYKRRLRWGLAASAVALAAAGLVLGIATQKARQPALPFAERDWVLITRFENRTGEAVFDGTLEYALERELSNSQFVNVVPRERVADALGFMKKPLDTRVDSTLGREICLRDGGIRAFIAGRVEKLDSTYLLSASLMDPARGVVVAGFSEEAKGQKAVLAVISRLCSRMREALGENISLIRRSEEKLEKVTTPSLQALKLFSQADAMIAQGKHAVAEELLKRAVADDPEFASGYMHLAWAIHNQTRPPSEFLPFAERALKLSETAGERERYFIQGSYYTLTDQRDKAIFSYEALVRLYPDHFWGVHNLASLNYPEGQIVERTLDYYAKLADLRPRDFLANYQAWEIALQARNIVRGKLYLERAQTLVTAEDYRDHPSEAVSLEFAPASEMLRQGDFQAVLSEVQRLEQTYGSRTADGRHALSLNLSEFYFQLGMLKASREWNEKVKDSGIRALGLAELEEERGDRHALRAALRHQLAYETSLGPATVARLARVGLVNDAQKLCAKFEARGLRLAHIDFAHGEIALAQGREEEGISRLRAAIPGMHHLKDERVSWAAESLARTLERRGDVPGAIKVLEPLDRDQLLRPVVQLYLADLYRKDGQEQQARAMEEKLLRMLAYADPDHPVLVVLKATPKAKSPNTSSDSRGPRPINPEAVELFLKGKHVWSSGGGPNSWGDQWRQQTNYYKQAIDKDPSYAQAYVELAQAYNVAGQMGPLHYSEAYSRAKAAATKAIAIDESLAEAHIALSFAVLGLDRDWARAERELKRAIELDPNSLRARWQHAGLLLQMGRVQEATAEAMRSVEIDPLPEGRYNLVLAWVYYQTRHYDRATEEYRKAQTLNPEALDAYAIPLGWLYREKGMYKEAIAKFQTVGDNPYALGHLGNTYARAGHRAEAQDIIRTLKARAAIDSHGGYEVALVYAGLGEKDQAFEWLEKAYQAHDIGLTYLKVDPPLDPLRADPRFQDLLRRMNFPA